MKKDRLLNPGIVSKIASLGHTEYLCICDCGLPIPKDVEVIDISVTAGLPKFLDVLQVVSEELVIESVIVASELETVNPALLNQVCRAVGNLPVEKILHEDFKKRVGGAKCVIRTGETSSYANIILVGGVNF